MAKKKTKGKKIQRVIKLVAEGKIAKALEIADNDIGLLFEVGTLFGEKGNHKIAEKTFDRLLQIDPNHAAAWYNKGVALGYMGKYDEEIKCYEEAIEIDPNDAAAWNNKGLALRNLGKYDEAVRCYDQAIEIDPNFAEVWNNKGVALGYMGKYDEEIKCYEEAIEIDPNHAAAWNNKGVALRNLGKYDEAVKCFEEAIEIDPNNAEVWNNKGVALGNLGKYDEEIKCYDQAIEIDPNHAAAWYNKGVALGYMGKYDEEIKCYEEAIEIDPNDAEVWNNKGVALGNLGKYDEAVRCYDQAIEIDPNSAETYGNKGITFLDIRKYDEAQALLRTASELFSKMGRKKDANKAHKYELLAINASQLISRMAPLDRRFRNCLKSKTLPELKEKTLEICTGVERVIKAFKKRQLPKDARELLLSKTICFSALSNVLRFEKVDLQKLGKSRGVFEKWGFDTFVGAVDSLNTVIRFLNKYNSLKEIPKEEEEFLLRVLTAAYVLDGKLTEEISGKFKGEPYTIKPTAGAKIEKEPQIIFKHIADTERKKEWVRFCLVQLDFSLKPQRPAKEFGYVLNERDKIKTKVFKALEVAQKNKVDVICFPELSFAKEWGEQIRNQYKEMIIIGGSYYDQGYNVCPIVINGVLIDPPYRKHRPSPFENPQPTGRGMKSGNILYIFQTKCGRFSVLTCIDYTDQSYRVCRYEDKAIDFIINPCCDPNLLRFQPRCNSDCEDYGIDVIQVNKAPAGEEYGRTCIIGKEHHTILEKLIDDGFKPEDDIKYKLFELHSEMMIIADLNIRMKGPPVSLPIEYAGRIRISKKRSYKYARKRWSS